MPRNNKNDLVSLLNKSLLINALLVIVVIVMAIALIYESATHTYTQPPTTTTMPSTTTSVNQSSTETLAGIDQGFNASQLAVINDGPMSYYEVAGQKLLNGSLTNEVVVTNAPQYNAIIINGKPSVIYIGAISCVFCGENRWAMALALSRFGNFSKLFYGYSSFGDGDVPTIYWNQDNYTTTRGVGYGNYYNSNYINFISADYESPITGGFEVGPLSYFVAQAPNATYATALSFMNSTNKFEGTPFTFWGTSLIQGADAVVFGNTTPSGDTLPLTSMTHQQVLGQLSSFDDQFSWSEYAAADVYVAQVCPAISNAAPVCSLPAIKSLEAVLVPS